MQVPDGDGTDLRVAVAMEDASGMEPGVEDLLSRHHQAGLAAVEQRREHLRQILIYLVERCLLSWVRDFVDVTGQTKGRGFAGFIKRWNFNGGRATHGSMFHRAPGSIGGSSYPSRVFPGMRAHGYMGVDRVTVRNLKVLKIDTENHLILVKGNVPGAPGGYVVIRKAVAAKPEPQPQLQEKPKKGKK